MSHKYGKVNFTKIQLPKTEEKWCYSAEELEQELNALFSGQIIKTVYADLLGYLESNCTNNRIDLSYLGDRCCIIINGNLLMFNIYTAGMFRYAVIPMSDVHTKSTKDFPPNDLDEERTCFFNLNEHDVIRSVIGKEIQRVKVTHTDMYPFSDVGFDEALGKIAEEKCDLPAEIEFITDDGCALKIVGGEMEGYMLETY